MAKGVHEYCCCAIPLLNVGIYLTLIEQFTVGLLGGILAVATPQIVGTAVPSFAAWLFAAGCFVGCAAQALGFIGVFKEKATLFQRFVQIHAFAVSYTFSIAATWIIVSATRHDQAKNNCVNTFFTSNSTDSGTTTDVFAAGGQGDTICNIFVWADVGIMGGLWLIMLIFQGYLLIVCRWYGTSQLADHSKYYSIYSVTAPDGIGLGERQQDAWDPRPSTESWSGAAAGNPRSQYRDHSRQNSDVTERACGVGADAFQKQPAYGHQNASPGEQAYNPYVSHPQGAYTNDSEPTPVALTSPASRFEVSQTYGSGAQPMAAPPGAVYPNEGQFGRKTPRAEDAYGHNQGYAGGGAGAGYAPSTVPSYHTNQAQYYPQR